jgi:hypothetical protein
MTKLIKAQLLNAHLDEADPEVFDIIEKVCGQDSHYYMQTDSHARIGEKETAVLYQSDPF